MGEIVAIAGIDSTAIGATLCDLSTPEPLEDIHITPPALRIKIETNSSPLAGKEGKFVTPKQLEQRLEQEKELNIGLVIEKISGSSYSVAGRGELQLAILAEIIKKRGV